MGGRGTLSSKKITQYLSKGSFEILQEKKVPHADPCSKLFISACGQSTKKKNCNPICGSDFEAACRAVNNRHALFIASPNPLQVAFSFPLLASLCFPISPLRFPIFSQRSFCLADHQLLSSLSSRLRLKSFEASRPAASSKQTNDSFRCKFKSPIFSLPPQCAWNYSMKVIKLLITHYLNCVFY